MASDTPPVLITHVGEGFRVWNMTELYTPEKDRGHVPNVDDMVLDWAEGFYRVVAVDITTGISRLTKWSQPRENEQSSDQDILLGAGPGTATERFRVYHNTRVTPHILAIDSDMHIYTKTADRVLVFEGMEIGERGKVISAFYDQSGNFISESIPLELVTMPDGANIAVKAPAVGYTNSKLDDGQIVSVVVYDDTGMIVSVNRLLVVNTDFIRTTDASMKYITAIGIETPFLSSSDPMNIEYPINMPVANLNLIGVVTYSDGSQIRLPVDGTKFSMFGLYESYIATIQGQKIPLVLTYHLGPNEYNYIGEPTPSKTISVQYTATTAKADGAYSVKLYPYPVWAGQANGYRLEYWLYNLERGDYYNVTNLVQMTSDTRSFDPLLYGTVQELSVGLNMKSVDPRFANYRHVQTFKVTLRSRGDDATQDNWHLGFAPGQSPMYGEGGLVARSRFINVGNWQLDISNGETDYNTWLEKVFYRTLPLFDPVSEERAPAPNFISLLIGNHEVEIPVTMWDSLITTHEMPGEGGLVYLRFMKRNASTDLQLGVSAMPVHQRVGT